MWCRRRLFYELALDQGETAAVTALAKTFDPLYLAQLGARQSLGDRAKAIAWYQRGADAGDSEAILRLKELATKPE